MKSIWAYYLNKQMKEAMMHNKWTADDERLLQELQKRKDAIISSNTKRLLRALDCLSFDDLLPKDAHRSIPSLLKDRISEYLVANSMEIRDALSYFDEQFKPAKCVQMANKIVEEDK
jgi:hypothetical protein